MQAYDVFISYRREGGDQAAKAIHDNLRDRGYRVFLDVEALRSGAFNTRLYNVIDTCRDVVVVLAPGSLDRCWNEEDWLRLEVVHALRSGKNLVPVMLRGFTFPDALPEDMEPLRMQNGVAASVEFFDAFLDKLCSFLHSRGGFFSKKVKHPLLRLAAVLLGILVLFGGVGSAIAAASGAFDYPMSTAQREEVATLIRVAKTQYTLADGILYEAETALMDCRAFVQDGTDPSWKVLREQLRQSGERVRGYQGKGVALSEPQVAALSRHGLDGTELVALGTIPDSLVAYTLSMVETLSRMMDPELLLTNGYRNRLLDLYAEELDLSADQLVTSFCQLTLPIREESLASFRQTYLPTLQFGASRLTLWSRNEAALEQMEAAYATRFKALLEGPEQMLDREEAAFGVQRGELLDMLALLGLSREEADTYVRELLTGALDATGSAQTVTGTGDGQARLAEHVAGIRTEMWERIAPKAEDDPYLVWGKALRFLRLGMRDEARETFSFFLDQMREEDEYAADYVSAAIRFVDQMDRVQARSGVLVAGYEPGKPHHEVFRPGDILIAVNGAPCRRYDEFEALSNQAGFPYQVTLLRPDETGLLQRMEVEIPEGQPRVALMELSEAGFE